MLPSEIFSYRYQRSKWGLVYSHFQNSTSAWFSATKLGTIDGNSFLEDRGILFVPGSVHKLRFHQKFSRLNHKRHIKIYLRNLWTVPGRKWMLRFSRKLFPATLPFLVDENQTVDEFWKWEESRPTFWSIFCWPPLVPIFKKNLSKIGWPYQFLWAKMYLECTWNASLWMVPLGSRCVKKKLLFGNLLAISCSFIPPPPHTNWKRKNK